MSVSISKMANVPLGTCPTSGFPVPCVVLWTYGRGSRSENWGARAFPNSLGMRCGRRPLCHGFRRVLFPLKMPEWSSERVLSQPPCNAISKIAKLHFGTQALPAYYPFLDQTGRVTHTTVSVRCRGEITEDEGHRVSTRSWSVVRYPCLLLPWLHDTLFYIFVLLSSFCLGFPGKIGGRKTFLSSYSHFDLECPGKCVPTPRSLFATLRPTFFWVI